jgi:hypothetical protein
MRNVGALIQLSNNTFNMYTNAKQRHSLERNVTDVVVLYAVTIRFGRSSKFRTFIEYMDKNWRGNCFFMLYVFRWETYLCNTCFCHPQFSAQSLVTTVPNATSKTLDIRYWYSLSYYFIIYRPACNWHVLYHKIPSEVPKMCQNGEFSMLFCEDPHNPSFLTQGFTRSVQQDASYSNLEVETVSHSAATLRDTNGSIEFHDNILLGIVLPTIFSPSL